MRRQLRDRVTEAAVVLPQTVRSLRSPMLKVQGYRIYDPFEGGRPGHS